jgi:hypothetical protein
VANVEKADRSGLTGLCPEARVNRSKPSPRTYRKLGPWQRVRSRVRTEEAKEDEMDTERFAESLLHLSQEEIRMGSANLDGQRSSAADDVAWWRVELAVEKLMRTRCSRAEVHRATAAGRRAARAVIEAAGRAGINVPDGDVTRIARVAGQIARGLSLGPLVGHQVQFLLGHWDRALGADPCREVLTPAA